MQNKNTLDLFVVLEEIYNKGDINLNYFISDAKNELGYYNEKRRLIEYTITDQETTENIEVYVNYSDFFNVKINQTFITFLNSINNSETIVNKRIITDWPEIISKLEYYL